MENLQTESIDPLLPVMSKQEFQDYFAPESINTFNQGESQVSVVNLGNDLLSWSVLLPQSEPGELAVIVWIDLECILYAEETSTAGARKR